MIKEDLLIILDSEYNLALGYKQNDKIIVKQSNYDFIYDKTNNTRLYKDEDYEELNLNIFILELKPYTIEEFKHIYFKYEEYMDYSFEDTINSNLENYDLELIYKPLNKKTKQENVIYTKAKLKICGDYVTFHEMLFNIEEVYYSNEECKRDSEYCLEKIVNAVKINNKLYIEI